MRMINADALLTEIQKKEAEPSYQHTGEDWCVGLIIAEGLVDEQPTIEPQKWILCSERLPEEETDVLVTRTFLGCKDGSHGWNNHIPPKTYVEVAQYFNGEWTALSDEYKVARNRHTDPIAWMPLPECYRGDGNVK